MLQFPPIILSRCPGPGDGGDCEAAGLDLRQHRGRPGRVRGEGELLKYDNNFWSRIANV